MTDKRDLAKMAALGRAAVSRRGLIGWTAAGAVSLSIANGRLTAAAPGGRRLPIMYRQEGSSTILIGTLGAPGSINPFQSDEPEGDWLCKMFYDEFVRPDPQNYGPTPGIAASWTVEDLTFTFAIQPNAKFSDGSDVTADDVKFTIESFLNPQVASNRSTKFTAIDGAEAFAAGSADTVSGIEVVDPKTIRITLARPEAAFLFNMRYVYVVPKALLEGKDLSRASTDPFWQSPIGAGPYLFQNWTAPDVVATANPNYWGGALDVANFTFRTIADSAALVNALQAGDIDGSLYAAPTLAEQLEANENLEILVPPFSEPDGTFFNCREAPLNDARVRRAIAMAVNVDEYVASSLLGLGAAGLGPIAPDSWAHDPTLEPIPFDPAGARALLDEAGVGDIEINMICNAGNVLREDWLIRSQADLQEIGLTVNVEFIEWATLVERVTSTQDFQVVGVPFGGVTHEPSELWDDFHSASAANYSGYSTPELDELLDQVKQTLDQEAAKPMYSQIQTILMQDVPMHWAWYRPFIHVINSGFTGYTGSNLYGGIFRTLPDMTGPMA